MVLAGGLSCNDEVGIVQPDALVLGVAAAGASQLHSSDEHSSTYVLLQIV